MKQERFQRTKSVVATSALALVVAAATFGITSVVVGTRNFAAHVGFDLTGSSCPANPLTPPNFSVCGPGVGLGPVLAPGAPPSSLPLTFYNPLHAPLSVESLSVTFTNTFPTGCGESALQIEGTSVNGGTPTVTGNPSQPNVTLTFAPTHPIPVPQASGSNPGTFVYNLTAALTDNHLNQNNCKGLPLTMSYSAAAQYSEVYGTTTHLVSSQNPSTLGQSVTYTATITAAPSAGQDPVPSSPTGAVTFKDNGSAISPSCTSVGVTSTGTTTSTASCTVAYNNFVGNPHPITAVYSNTDGNYTGSTSNPVSQQVNPIGTSLVLTSSPSGTALFGQNVTLKATISPASGPTGTVSFYLGTPSGTHELLGTSTLSGGVATLTKPAELPGTNSLYAIYGGSTDYAASTSNLITLTVSFSVACINNTINGGYTVKAGQSICISGRVNGGVTVDATGSLYLDGALINGGTTSSGATELRFCGSTINGDVNITGTTGFALIGDQGDTVFPPVCAGNTINALSVNISNNRGGLEFGANKVDITVTFSGNTGGAFAPIVEGNSILGILICPDSNVPALTDGGVKNHVIGLSTGECSGNF